jgi:nucleoid-associated protein YejK
MKLYTISTIREHSKREYKVLRKIKDKFLDQIPANSSKISIQHNDTLLQLFSRFSLNCNVTEAHEPSRKNTIITVL